MATSENLFYINSPRWQTESIFSQLDLTGKFFFVFNITDPGWYNPDIFPFDVFYEKMNYAKENNLEFIVIFEETYEAPCYYDIQDLIDTVSLKSNIPTEQMFIMSGAQHQNGAPIGNCNIVCVFGNELLEEVEPRLPTHHFVSLARYSRIHRVLVTKEIWSRKLDAYGYCSLGCVDQDIVYSPVKEILGEFADRYPAVIDRMINWGDGKPQPFDHKLTGAFLNVALETSYELDVNKQGWSVPFWTEKSSKPFAWRQVPLILGPLGSLDIFRQFKFDLFEDIIDTGYDKEVNPYKRIKLYVNEIEKICSWPLEKCIEYKQENMNRFDYNRNLFIESSYNTAYQYSLNNASKAFNIPIKL